MDDVIKWTVVIGVATLALALALYALILAVIAVVIMSCLGVGLVSLAMAKSSKALVTEETLTEAFILATVWSSALTIGCILGSYGLLAGLTEAVGPSFKSRLEAYTLGGPPVTGSFWSFWIWFSAFIMGSAYMFFLKTTIVLLCANRVFVARCKGGSSWWGVLPPVIAIAIFLIGDHWALIMSADGLGKIIEAFISSIFLPFQLVAMAFREPNAIFAWFYDRILASDGNMFKIKDVFPLAFWLVALACSIKALEESSGD